MAENKRVTGVVALLIGVITPFATGCEAHFVGGHGKTLRPLFLQDTFGCIPARKSDEGCFFLDPQHLKETDISIIEQFMTVPLGCPRKLVNG